MGQITQCKEGRPFELVKPPGRLNSSKSLKENDLKFPQIGVFSVWNCYPEYRSKIRHNKGPAKQGWVEAPGLQMSLGKAVTSSQGLYERLKSSCF
jgi:hypothetical protein